MTKGEIITAMQNSARGKCTKADTERAFNAVFDTIKDAVAKGESVTIPHFGTFKAVETKARTGRNPSTNEIINIPAGRKPKFRPSISFKDAVSGK